MTDRTYRTILGLILLIVLYFDLELAMYGVIAMLFIEGITNQRIPKIICFIRRYIDKPSPALADVSVIEGAPLNIDSERAWRISVGSFLFIGYSIDLLWFFPWFMGFAIFGAGLSGVCPVLFGLRWIGFR